MAIKRKRKKEEITLIENKKKIVLGAIILLSLLLVFFIFRWTSTTGKAIEEEITGDIVQESQSYYVSCDDSDNGKNYLSKGSIQQCKNNGECEVKEDYCSGDASLMEAYCENNEGKYETYSCSVACYDGVCADKTGKFYYPYQGGGGGGGSGATTTTPTAPATIGQTHELGALNSERQLELSDSDRINFAFSNSNYVFSVESHSQTSATISTGTGAGILILNIREPQLVDLNSDSLVDVSIELRSVNLLSGKSKIFFRPA